MRAKTDALRYAVLSSLRPTSKDVWRTTESDARAMTDQAFDAHVAALCAVARDVRAQAKVVGAKSATRIKDRVAARELASTRRTALDLQRLADLEDRMELRQAEAARRRWFVLGRLFDRAAKEDAAWASALDILIARSALTAHEARALGIERPASRR
jgi:hypothetical protein